MDIKPGEITDILKREIKDYDRQIDVAETGTVLSAGDGIARVYGLDNALAGELVEFGDGLRGMVLTSKKTTSVWPSWAPDVALRKAISFVEPDASSKCPLVTHC